MLDFLRLAVLYRPILISIIMLSSFICTLGNAADNKNLISQKEFTQKFIGRIRSNNNIKQITILDDANISVSFLNKVQARAYLGNAYRRYTHNPNSLKSIIDSYANSIISMGNQKNNRVLDTTIIVPIIRHKDYVKVSNIRFAKQSNAMKKKGATKPVNKLLTQRFTNELFILFALDTKHNYQYLTTSDLKKYKTTLKVISKHAHANINRLTPTIKKLSEGMYSVKYDTNLDVSFLLHNKLWQSTLFKIKGKLLVYLPTRNMLIVTGTQDIKNRFIMKKWINKNYRTLSYFISEVPLTRKGNTWTPFTKKLTFQK